MGQIIGKFRGGAGGRGYLAPFEGQYVLSLFLGFSSLHLCTVTLADEMPLLSQFSIKLMITYGKHYVYDLGTIGCVTLQ